MRRQILTVSGLTAIGQIAAFGKLWLTARLFGVGVELDGYFLALVLPTLVSGTISGLVQTSFFPIRARLHASAEWSTVLSFERSMLVLLLVVGLLLSFVFLAIGSNIVRLSQSEISEPIQHSLDFVFIFAVFLIPLNIVGDSLGYLLAMRDRFPIAAASPIANAFLGAIMLVLWPEGQLLNLTLGTLLGLALQVSICAYGLSRCNFQFLGRLNLNAAMWAEWKRMLQLSGWALPGVIFSNLNAALPTILVVPFGEGAISAFGYAWRLHQYAIQILIVAISPILLAKFSQLIADGHEHLIQGLLKKSLWVSVAIGLAVTVFVHEFGQFILSFIFKGRFDEESAHLVATYWYWLSLGLASALLSNIIAKVLQARGRAGYISYLAGIGFAVLIISSYLLSEWLEGHAIPAAIGLASTIIVLQGWWAAWRPAPKHLLT